MIDQLFMKDLAYDLAPPLEPVEQPATLLAAGPATSDVGRVTVQGYKPGQETAGGAFVGTRLNTPKAGQPQPTTQDREKLAIGLLDSLAGALRGAVAQTIGLPGDIRSIVDMISKEGADKYLGQAVMPTTEEMLASTVLPPVLGEGAINIAERQPTVETAQQVGTFLPAPGIPEAAIQGAKLVGKAIKATKGLPVGMSTQAVGEGVDELGFYSAAKQAVDAIQQPKGTGSQFLAQIEKTPGVKPDEIKWTGLDEFLKSKKSVTKAEVQEYLDKNRVEVKEVQLGAEKLTKKFSVNSPEDEDYYDVINKAGKVIYTGPEREADKLLDLDTTKFSKYTLPGGENYREVLLTLPAKEVPVPTGSIVRDGKDAEYPFAIMVNGKEVNRVDSMEFANEILQDEIRRATSKVDKASQFKSSHFDQPNILAHLRVNDRVDADGKKVLFVEEIQSDWHQAGRKKGYQTKLSKEESAELEALYKKEKEGDGLLFSDDADRLTELENKLSVGVPDAPFKTTWSELAMKRAIQMASEGGYDRIAFTTGKTQAERFDLSKQVERITAIKDGNNFKIMGIDTKGNSFDLGKKSVDELPEIVGKDLAEKIAKQDTPNAQYAGKDLVVGGEGMKGFYDDILPKFLNKYAKKWDAKAGMTEIKVGEDKVERGMVAPGIDFIGEDKITKAPSVSVHYIDITPKMRESVMTKGQPMFAIGAGGAGAAATQQEDNK